MKQENDCLKEQLEQARKTTAQIEREITGLREQAGEASKSPPKSIVKAGRKRLRY